MYSLQTSVQVGRESFEISDNGDFRMVLDCFDAMNDIELPEMARVYSALTIFYADFETVEELIERQDILPDLFKAMCKFINGGEEEKQSNTKNYRVIDWQKDSNLICSAINNVAKTEIRALEYLHWWTFLSYYNAIGDCILSHIVSIRYKIARGEKLEKHEQKFRMENPDYFDIDMRTTEQREIEEQIRQMWNKG